MKIVQNISFLKASGKIYCTIEFSFFFTYASTGQKYVRHFLELLFLTLESLRTI